MLTPRRLARLAFPAAATALYTAPAAVRTRIDAFAVVNTTGAAATFNVWLVTAGDVAGPANTLVASRSIAAGSSARVLEAIGQWLESGDAIFAQASAGATITAHLSGLEQTTA